MIGTPEYPRTPRTLFALNVLSELTDDAGIVHGILRNLLHTAGLNLDAVGVEAFLYHDNFEIRADGNIASPGYDVDSSGNASFDGTVKVGGSIESPNYSAGVDGWQVNAAGDAEFNDVTIRRHGAR